MSIVRQLLQIAAVQAMRGRTVAKEAIFDSRIGPLPDILKGEEKPILVVSIEESEQPEDGGNDAGFFGRSIRFTMLVQAAVASAVSVDIDGEETVTVGIGETDAGYEATLNVLERQWRMALSKPADAWAELFRDLVLRVGVIRDARGINPKSGHRHASRFTEVVLTTVPEPVPGEESQAVARGITMLEGHPDYAELGALLRSLLSAGTDATDWQKLRHQLFGSEQTLLAVGIAPLVSEEDTLTTAILERTGLSGVTVTGDA